MIRLLFVGDGQRDAATVPRLVEGILGNSVQEETRSWVRLHGARRGYGKKLLFTLRVAKDRRVDGLVATLDSDKEKPGQRLKQLKDARAADREKHPALPMAVGEAVPHGEAWLLDDPKAVRATLKMDAEAKIPSTQAIKNPKQALEELLSESPRSIERTINVLADAARHVRLENCRAPKKTGFAAFEEEVRTELGPLTK